jgi:hypothetical protein
MGKVHHSQKVFATEAQIILDINVPVAHIGCVLWRVFMQQHVAILVQPACCTALLVDVDGSVSILRQGSSLSVEGFAYGYAFALGLDEPTVRSADAGNAIQGYRSLLAA